MATPKKISSSQKIAIIGAGAVGSTIAYTMMLKNLASEVILIDVNETKEAGEVMDIADALSFVETGCVRGANFRDAASADIIIVTAGAPQKPGETRMDLVDKNKTILKSIFKKVGKIKKSTIVVIVSNPVDVLTYVAQEITGLPKNQVFGTGTSLDTARLQNTLAHQLGANAQNIGGYVLGEHGDSEFVAWSTVTIGGLAAASLFPTKEGRIAIEESIRQEAYEIINRKGATFYGIAATVTDIVEAIIFNQHKILPLSVRVNDWNGVSGVCLGVPAVLGKNGIEQVWPIELPAAEKKSFKKSAETLRRYLK